MRDLGKVKDRHGREWRVRVFDDFEEAAQAEFEDDLAMSPEARVAAVHELRLIFFRLRGERAPTSLRRVCRVTDLATGEVSHHRGARGRGSRATDLNVLLKVKARLAEKKVSAKAAKKASARNPAKKKR